MKKRFVLFALLALAALPTFARVLSYAPYSSRNSLAGFHSRTSRHFVLIESVGSSNVWQLHQAVLYDSKGEQEPRVVYPTDGTAQRIEAVALYEPRDTDAANPTPVLLVAAHVPGGGGLQTRLSVDGGATWKEIASLRNFFTGRTLENDFGGPDAQGLTNPIRFGTDAWPFIASYSYNGIYAISHTGETRAIATGLDTWLIGQDRTGTKLLVKNGDRLEVRDLNNPAAPPSLSFRAHNDRTYTGWITSNGAAYIQATHASGRYLFLARPNSIQFVLGPYDVAPPGGLTDPWPVIGHSSPMDFFAVPTHDHDGAWVVQRKMGKPTTLLQHTTSGTSTKWVDPAGPEVEALITGASGQTLLVQIHRDRSVEMQRPFIDPALAVWRIGEGAPQHYDELYLNEEWNKGFIHVDVDRISQGEPFVFNSGAIADDGDIITSPPAGGGDVIQEWGVVRASLRQHLVLPGVARLNGAFGSRWLTDVTMANNQPTPQEVEVRFLSLGEVHTAEVRTKVVTLAPYEIRFLPDALHALFAIEDGGGALHFIPAGEGINVVGRTYSRRAQGGTYGFGMQGIDFFNASSPRFPVSFAGAFPGEHFRTNVLITDTSGRGTEAEVGAYGVTGPIGGPEKRIQAPAGGVMQFNEMGTQLNLFSREAGGMVIQPTRGSAITTVVAIDNRTNDPTYFPPDLPASEQIRVIPVIGHLDGANGSHFRSDLHLFNPTSTISTITLEAKQWDSPETRTTQFTLLPNEARMIADALPTLFTMTGLARLRYWSNTTGDGVRVTSRTYTLEESGATYGSLIPPLNNFQMAGFEDTLEILGANGGAGFRTNLGLVELSPTAQQQKTTVLVTLYDPATAQWRAFAVEVPRGGGIQLNDIFAAQGMTPPVAPMIQVKVLSSGLIGAYATLVDNITNDTTYLGAQLGASSND